MKQEKRRFRLLIDPTGVVHDGVRVGPTSLHLARCEREGSVIESRWTNEELRQAPRGAVTTCVQCIAGRCRD